MLSGVSRLPRSVVGGLAGLVLALLLLPSTASAAGTSSVMPITSFTVTTQLCAGGIQSPIVADLQQLVTAPGPGLGPLGGLPIISLNPECTTAPSVLPLLYHASNTASGSSSGSATISSEALGNVVLGEEAYGDVDLDASIPLAAPATSVDLSVPYTTSGVTWSSFGNYDQAQALLIIQPTGPWACADGSFVSASPYEFLTSLGTPTPPGSGTLHFHVSCPDGSDLVSVVHLDVAVATSVDAVTGRTESASANVSVHGVTATINS